MVLGRIELSWKQSRKNSCRIYNYENINNPTHGAHLDNPQTITGREFWNSPSDP